MATNHRGYPVGNPNTSHGGHEPTPLQNWNKYKTQKEKDSERFRGYADEITKTGGNPDALGSPYLDPYDGFKTPSSLNDPAWENDRSGYMDETEETENGDYYERQISDDARRD